MVNCLNCGKDISARRAHARYCSNLCNATHFRLLNPDHQRRYWRKCVYGLTFDEFNAMLEAQNGKCALCQEKEVGFGPAKGQWNVDHSHSTGAVRGILCSHCNMALGMLKDNPELMRKAIEYLER